MQHKNSSSKRETYNDTELSQEIGKISNKLTLHLEELEKQSPNLA